MGLMRFLVDSAGRAFGTVPTIGETYVHLSTGNDYVVVHVAHSKIDCEARKDIHDGALVVVYRSVGTGRLYIRTTDDFWRKFRRKFR